MKAAGSHTGALAGSKDLFESACRQAGLVTAPTIEQAGITASSFLNRPLPAGRRVAIVTGGGGLGVIAADACTDMGLDIVRLSEPTLEKIGEYMPDYWVPGNPVDLVAGLDLRITRPILETLLTCGEVDSVLLIFIESQRSKPVRVTEVNGQPFEIGVIWDMMTQKMAEYLKEMYVLAREVGVPLFVSSNFEKVGGAAPGTLGGGENPMVHPDVESACASIAAMADYAGFRRTVS